MHKTSNITTEDIKPGSIVSCTVNKILTSHLVLKTCLKSDLVLPKSEFNTQENKIGDKHDCLVLSLDDGRGNVIASRKLAIKKQSISYISDCLANNKTVKGQITRSMKGGYAVQLNSINAFLPGSLTDFNTSAAFPEEEREFRIVHIDEQRDNVVVSLLSSEHSNHNQKTEDLIKTLQVGEERVGIVKNLATFGAFINIGVCDGLVYISDISWKRMEHPSEELQIGDEVRVKILRIKDNRVFLGIKQLITDPWLNTVQNELNAEHIYDATVTSITSYGVFLYLNDYRNIEGLVHCSQLSWYSKGKSLLKNYLPGDSLKVKLYSTDVENRRIAFSCRTCVENPWPVLKETYKQGDVIEGTVATKADFGIFVNIKEDLDGLIHYSKNQDLQNRYDVGDKIMVSFVSVNVESRRIEIQHHDQKLQKLNKYVELHHQKPVSCLVTSASLEEGLSVSLEDSNLEGFIALEKLEEKYKKMISKEDIVGKQFNAIVITHNKSKILLSTVEHHAQKDIFAPIKHVSIGSIIKSKLSSQMLNNAAQDNKDAEEEQAPEKE